MTIRAAIMACAALVAAWAEAGEGLLRNADFREALDNDEPHWRVGRSGQRIKVDKTEKPDGAGQSVRVDAQKPHAKGHYGEISQKLSRLKPHATYILRGRLKSTAAGMSSRVSHCRAVCSSDSDGCDGTQVSGMEAK